MQGSEDGGSGDTVPVRQNGGGTVPTCQVEKCRKELTGLTTYHQRCRICEVSRPGPSAKGMQFWRIISHISSQLDSDSI